MRSLQLAALRAASFLIVGALLAAPGFAAEPERISELLTRGTGEIKALEIRPGLWLASGNSNAYLVETEAGAVLIDTGLGPEAERTHAALRAATDAPVRKLILTHAHADHIGGVSYWQGDGVETIAAKAFALRNRYYHELRPFQAARARVLWANVMPEGGEERFPYPRVSVDRFVDGAYTFELGGLTFEVLETPGGEGPDAVSVWIPEWRALFSGDALGPSTAAFPNLFTLRGENIREAVPIVESLERMAALEPELLLTGHLDPLSGADEIRETLTRTASAIRYVYDATVAGMNAGKDVWTLMREITLPPELEVSEEYGRVAWGVRAIWESHVGWFRYESTTELYDVPAHEIYPDLVAAAGGPGALTQAAMTRLVNGQPLHALHLAEVVLAADPLAKGGLVVKRAALQALAENDGGKNFQLGGWLRHELAATEAVLADLAAMAPR